MTSFDPKLRQRLLQDIAELQAKPYPNISLHIVDEDITQACLVLTVERYGSIHMTVEFPSNYPLRAPQIRMNSKVYHPNIFEDYICASILNTEEGYTSAYTLKSIAIQMLSFFSSDRIEQEGGRYSISLQDYKSVQSHLLEQYKCDKCGHGMPSTNAELHHQVQNLRLQVMPPLEGEEAEIHWPSPEESKRRSMVESTFGRRKSSPVSAAGSSISPSNSKVVLKSKNIAEMDLPDEILLMICDKLDTEDLMVFAEAWIKIGAIMSKYDVIRTRELRCFCFKKDYKSAKLGVGVSIARKGKIGSIESEFDLLSHEGFYKYGIRKSVQGVYFDNWLPLPISYGHWRTVQADVSDSLQRIAAAAPLENVPDVEVVYRFMNDIVVKLNQTASATNSRWPYYQSRDAAKSSLTHASEKAIESYFHLFHLLLCLATENPEIVKSANKTLNDFANGANSKSACPNLGRLLVAALISDVEMTPTLIKAIIKEIITRNVVWMLDPKGSGMAELSYLEPSEVSNYRLQRTFEASQTSYRLLMFLNLFRGVAVGNPRKPLAQLRDEAFERHGAPPRGSAKGLANSIKRIHLVEGFPGFLEMMGIDRPSPAWFTRFLRECIEASIAKGYSRMPISQVQALSLRQAKEPDVEVADGLQPQEGSSPYLPPHNLSFFPGGPSRPNQGTKRNNWGPRGPRGRGRGR